MTKKEKETIKKEIANPAIHKIQSIIEDRVAIYLQDNEKIDIEDTEYEEKSNKLFDVSIKMIKEEL